MHIWCNIGESTPYYLHQPITTRSKIEIASNHDVRHSQHRIPASITIMPPSFHSQISSSILSTKTMKNDSRKYNLRKKKLITYTQVSITNTNKQITCGAEKRGNMKVENHQNYQNPSNCPILICPMTNYSNHQILIRLISNYSNHQILMLKIISIPFLIHPLVLSLTLQTSQSQQQPKNIENDAKTEIDRVANDDERSHNNRCNNRSSNKKIHKIYNKLIRN